MPTVTGMLPAAERMRIDTELAKIARLGALTGIRGTSEANVTKHVVRRLGADARKTLRALTPRGKKRPDGRKRLSQTVRGRLEVNRRTGTIKYRVGYQTRLTYRFQQALAVEFGTKHQRARKPVERAKTISAGKDGEKLGRAFVREMDIRIGVLAMKANARARV